MADLSYIFREMTDNRIGLAPHYLFLYSAVVGLEAKSVFEFGAGMSTRVILDALRETGGELWSCSTEEQFVIVMRSRINHYPKWRHRAVLSNVAIKEVQNEVFDLVLHDGSHAGDVVEADLRAILPRVRQYGLVLVHDTQHSYVGAEMRKAVSVILRDFDVSHVTLPYGFGLTVLRTEAPWHPPVTITRSKIGSSHKTALCRVGDKLDHKENDK